MMLRAAAGKSSPWVSWILAFTSATCCSYSSEREGGREVLGKAAVGGVSGRRNISSDSSWEPSTHRSGVLEAQLKLLALHRLELEIQRHPGCTHSRVEKARAGLGG